MAYIELLLHRGLDGAILWKTINNLDSFLEFPFGHGGSKTIVRCLMLIIKSMDTNKDLKPEDPRSDRIGKNTNNNARTSHPRIVRSTPFRCVQKHQSQNTQSSFVFW